MFASFTQNDIPGTCRYLLKNLCTKTINQNNSLQNDVLKPGSLFFSICSAGNLISKHEWKCDF